MAFSLSRWRVRHLLATWIAYWFALAAVTLGPAADAALPVIYDTSGHGSISASVSNTLLQLTIQREGTTLYTASAHLANCAMWFAVPPLLLWAAWLASRPRREQAHTAAPRAS